MCKPPIDKVLIYATWKDRLLVFDEPDFPEILPQVPGGTVEPGEALIVAAQREFAEESGLTPVPPPIFLVSATYAILRDGEHILHNRHFYHIALSGPFCDSWTNLEMFPHGSDVPVTFRFFWLSLAQAEVRLGYEQQAALPFLQNTSDL